MAEETVSGREEALAALQARVGSEIHLSDWLPITQERIDAFAAATGDQQWIHVDPERCARESPYGAPIAHGYLTLSLTPVLMGEVLHLKGISMGVNYGANKVRFMSPVPVGANLRLGVKVLSVDDIAGGIQSTYELTFETEGAAKPSCVAECIFRNYV